MGIRLKKKTSFENATKNILAEYRAVWQVRILPMSGVYSNKIIF